MTYSMNLNLTNGEVKTISLTSFVVTVETEDCHLMAESDYNSETLNFLQQLVEDKIDSVSVKNEEEETIYTGSEWNVIKNITINYNEYTQKMRINYLISQ